MATNADQPFDQERCVMEAIEEFILGLPRDLWLVFSLSAACYVVITIGNKLDRLQSAVWDLESRIDELEANQEDVDEDDDW